MFEISVLAMIVLALFVLLLVAIWRRTPIAAVWRDARGEFSLKLGSHDEPSKQERSGD